MRVTKSVGTDQIPPSAASDMGLHRFFVPVLRVITVFYKMFVSLLNNIKTIETMK